MPGELAAIQAISWRSRLLGLAMLDELPSRTALLIPRCRSVHTFGMRFPLDVAFLDEAGRLLRLLATVPPGRICTCRGARAVLEASAGEGERFLAAIGLRRGAHQALEPERQG